MYSVVQLVPRQVRQPVDGVLPVQKTAQSVSQMPLQPHVPSTMSSSSEPVQNSPSTPPRNMAQVVQVVPVLDELLLDELLLEALVLEVEVLVELGMSG